MNNNLQGLYRMKLQLLAEESEELVNNNAENKNNNAEGKTYTEEELKTRLQSETDRRVTEALKTAQSKWQKEYEAKLEKEKSEAEKLAKMTADERAKAEFEKEREKFEKDRQKFYRDQLELETVKELSKQGLDTEFSSFLMGKDAEATNENIKLFKEKFDSAIENAVNERLKGKTPKTTDKPSNLTIEAVKNMTAEEINANWESIKNMKF